MTSNSSVDITDEFRSIAASLSALIEGLSYIDADVAEKMAVEFSDKLVVASRAVYADMAGKIAEELSKPKKRKARRRKVATTVVDAPGYSGYGEGVIPVDNSPRTVYPDDEQLSDGGRDIIGRETLPPNPNSFLDSGNGPIALENMDEELQAQLGGQEITNRASAYPPVRDQQGQNRRPGTPQRMSKEEMDDRGIRT